MTDETLDARFERDIRSTLLRGVPADAPTSLRLSVARIPYETASTGRSRPSRSLMFGALAAGLAVIFVATLAILMGSLRPQPGPISRPSASASSSLPSVGPTVVPSGTAGTLHESIDFHVLPDAPGDSPSTDDVDAVMNVMLDRLSTYGITSTGAHFEGEGTSNFSIEVDVASDDVGALDRIADVLTAPGQLTVLPLDEASPMPHETDGRLPPTLFTQAGVTSASFATSDIGAPTLTFVLTSSAQATLATWTSAHLGSQIEVVLDGHVELEPVIQSAITGGILAFVGDDANTLKRLAAIVSSGPLRFPVVYLRPGNPIPTNT
jgi:SecD-like export protein